MKAQQDTREALDELIQSLNEEIAGTAVWLAVHDCGRDETWCCDDVIETREDLEQIQRLRSSMALLRDAL